MASQLHVVFIPYLSPSHLMPMVDIARMLAHRSIFVTIVTTPLNAARFHNNINRDIESGLPIQILQLSFPAREAGLPEGCESFDLIPSPSLYKNFFAAANMLKQPIEKLLEELQPIPNCIIADKALPWTEEIASKFQIPWLLFDGTSGFNLLCSHNLHVSKVHETVSESEPFIVPGLPDRIEFTPTQLPVFFNPKAYPELKDVRNRIIAAEEKAYGVLINSFEELELDYIKEYKKVRPQKMWCVGPVSLCNKEETDMAQRGSTSSAQKDYCLNWLNSQAPGSVIYVCLGSLNRLTSPQMVELGLALEASNRPFIWVIRGGYKKEETEHWLEENGFEERVKGRGLVIRGWAPQVLILSHSAIGGFLTHCGWNSTLEGICAGVPMVTWPLFAEQFLNEKLVVQVLGIGVRVGTEVVVHLGDEERFGVLLQREKIAEAIDRGMGGSREGEERRTRAKEVGEKAKRAVEEGGSSYLNITLLIEDLKQQAMKNQIKS